MYQKLFKREHIENQLKGIQVSPLFIISAPSGYGKTCAVKNYFEATKNDVAWISLYSSVDKHYFWSKLLEKIKSVFPDIYENVAMLNMPIVDETIVAKAIESVCELTIQKKRFIVIDDFQNNNDELVVNFIKGITKKNIENLHMVIITREDHLKCFNDIITIADWLGANGLRLDEKELQEYAKVLGIQLSSEQIIEIYKISNGWIACAYLLMKGISKGIKLNQNNDISMLIKKVLFNSYDEKTKHILLKLSFLDSFTLQQARFILDDAHIDRQIYRLCEDNDFISFNKSDDEYVIHNTLLTFLRQEIKRIGLDMKPLYLKAGEWAHKQNDYLNLYKYYYLAGDKKELLEKASTMLQIDKFYDVPDYFMNTLKNLKEEDYLNYPLALMDAGLMLMLNETCEKQKLGGTIIVILKMLAQRSKKAFGDLHDRVLGETHLMGLFLEFNNIKKIASCISKAKSFLEGNHSLYINSDSERPFEHTHILYTFYKKQGQLKKTMDLCASTFHDFSEMTGGFMAGIEYVVLAEYCLETGDIENAEINAYKAIFKAGSSNQLLIELCGVFTLLRLNILKGNKQDLYSLLEDIKKKISHKGNDYYYIPKDLISGYIYACIGKIDKIAPWLKGNSESNQKLMAKGMGHPQIIRGKILIAERDFHKLEVQRELTDKALKQYNNGLGLLHNQIQSSICDLEVHGIDKAKNTMQKAVKMGEKDCILMPFAEYAPYVLEILSHMDVSPNIEYVSKIKKMSKKYLKGLSLISKGEVFTNRETEIIKLSAGGLNREEISKELFVSVHTVKRHLLSIYRRLDCKNKVEMVEKARKLDII